MNRLVRILPIALGLFGAVLIFACSNDTTAPRAPELAVVGPGPGEFTRCKPQPYASNAAWIGPKGGKLRTGNQVLYVPAGALSTPTWITMETPSGNINRVVFGPEGLTFNPSYPAHLVMSYQNCSFAPAAEQKVAYVSPSLRIIETTPSENDPITLTVDAKLTHFSDYVLLSTYAVAY